MLQLSKRKKQFLFGGLVLSASALFMRTVSVFFNAYTVSRVGAEGMGLFTLTMSLYGFFLTLATSGIGLAVTRLVAEAIGHSDGTCATVMLRRSFFYACFCGLLASTVLFLGAPFFASVILRDMRTLPSLRFLAISLTPIAISSVFSGYFIAVRRASKNAAVQVAEQWIKIGLTVFLLGKLVPYGVTWACVALVLGGMLGELLSCLILYIAFSYDRHVHPIQTTVGRTHRDGWRPLLEIALPIAGGAYVRSALVTVEHVLIPLALAAYGAGKEAALASYGALHSMALPIILYPMALLTSFAGLLIPEYTESQALDDKKRLRRMTEDSLSATFAFALGAATVMFLFGEDLGILLYSSKEAGRYIRLLAFLVPVMYLDHVTDAMLKGIGMQVYAMVVNIGDSFLSILMVLLLLPRFGAIGYIGVILIAEVVNFLFSYIGMRRRLHAGLSVRAFFLPLPSLILAFLCTQLFTNIPLSGGAQLVFKMAIFCLIYIFSLAFVKGDKKEERRGSQRGVVKRSEIIIKMSHRAEKKRENG